MSTISVSNITTANGSESLTISTGNTSAGDIVIGSTGGVVIASNSTVNTIVANTTGSFFTGNVAIFRLLANAALGTAGQVLVSGGSGANAYWETQPTFFGIKETVFVANGTFTKDANLISLMVYCVGAGGGGGGSNSAATATGAKGGAGGGGGGTTVKSLLNSEVGATSNVVVGIGGAGGANATVSTGVAGSNSTFANSTGGLITGGGGEGGSNTTPGAAGTAVNGDINVTGGRGNAGAGIGGNFNRSIGGQGGSSGLGFGTGGNMITGSEVGVDGDLYGGAGGGSSSANTGTVSRAGGAGANGVVWIIEYYTN